MFNPLYPNPTKRVRIAAEIHGQSKKSWVLYARGKLHWCPKKHIKDNKDGTFSMPDWLARNKGFI